MASSASDFELGASNGGRSTRGFGSVIPPESSHRLYSPFASWSTVLADSGWGRDAALARALPAGLPVH